jgi:hypothetical protein
MVYSTIVKERVYIVRTKWESSENLLIPSAFLYAIIEKSDVIPVTPNIGR